MPSKLRARQRVADATTDINAQITLPKHFTQRGQNFNYFGQRNYHSFFPTLGTKLALRLYTVQVQVRSQATLYIDG